VSLATWKPKMTVETHKNKTDSKTSRYDNLDACRSTGRSTDTSPRKELLASVDWAVDRSYIKKENFELSVARSTDLNRE